MHQKGIFPAREAVVMQQQERGVRGVTAEEVFIGNGVSELIDLTLRALLNAGDEVLVPSPGLSAVDGGGQFEHAAARCTIRAAPERGFVPDPEEIEALDHPPHPRASSSSIRTIPTGAVYPRATLAAIARIAEKHRLVVLSRRDLRPDSLRRRRVRAHGDSRAGHAVLHDERLVEGVPGLRLSRRLGGLLRRRGERRASI